MKNPNLQLMVYGKDISKTTAEISYRGVELKSQTTLDNPNYLFINLIISKDAQAGSFDIIFRNNNKIAAKYKYTLLERRKNSALREGFNNSDVMYLIMPDRFANGDESNDNSKNTIEKVNRKEPYGRHGGDLKGIADHLDYLKDLGITSIWLNPTMENNQEAFNYHGYAISDYYKVDPRLGTNEEYKSLSNECNKRGIKLVKDVITNHCGIAHWWMKDLPSKDWIHQFDTFTRCNFRANTITDPYASSYDTKLNTDGWFDNTMPDLNQNNPYVLNYLTQNTIWWIEYADLGGVRIDTYIYNDKIAMGKFCNSIMEEYPNFNIVGECWLHDIAEEAYWQKDTKNPDGFNSYLPTTMDFPLFDIIAKTLGEEEGWDTGAARLYQHFSKDYLYANAYHNLIFLDNHDTDRFTSSINSDFNKYKLGLTLLLTTRGIPQLYYGIESMTEGTKAEGGDAALRKEFIGGWKDHTRNTFTREGRTEKENQAFDFISKLLKYRNNNPVIHSGKMTHYVPEQNCYVYFRSNNEKTIMVILNINKKDVTLDSNRYKESLKDFSNGLDIISNKEISSLEKITIPAQTSMIIELK